MKQRPHSLDGIPLLKWLLNQCTLVGRGCLRWNRSASLRGYPCTSYRGTTVVVHRLTYQLASGIQIPKGMCACHQCDFPLCVNPDHIFIGTHAENLRDAAAKSRLSSGRGSKNVKAKLSEADVLEIRRRMLHGARDRDLCVDFAVNNATISHIRHHRTWRHLK